MKDYNPDDKTLLSNWFDPYNIGHVKAWKELRDTGVWPSWFTDLLKESGISIDRYWDITIKSRMCDAWVNYALKVVAGG